MNIFGLDIRRRKKELSSVGDSRNGWWRILESFTGAWQQNVEVDVDLALSYHAVYSCITLIASDIAKLRVKLVQLDANGIWSETTNPAYSPVLRKPNHFQNRIQFFENWELSKLMRGNTYVLKVRDNRRVVTSMYVLDPTRVTPLVADDGSIFYRLDSDNISGLEDAITVPAREIIHDRMNCLFHPLVGTSPLFAAGLAAMQGLNIQRNSTKFFGNQSQPGGILAAPGAIADETAKRLKEYWDDNFTGKNAGKVAVVGDGLKYEPLSVSAHDAQLIEQLKWSADVVCSTFGVPAYKVGLGEMPTYSNIQALNVEYYSQCLQKKIEDLELCLNEGLEMRIGLGTQFELNGLLRMDSVTMTDMLDKAVKAGVMSPNEGRRRMELPPVEGGETPYLQEQNYSLQALARRDAQADPFNPAPAEPANDNLAVQASAALVEIKMGLHL